MDPAVEKLTTAEECDQFVLNTSKKWPDAAHEAKRKGFLLRAEKYGAKTAVELDALQAVFAYEDTLSVQRGKRVPASRTWQMIKRLGIVPAVARIVDRPDDTSGWKTLVAMNLADLLFESVVVRHASQFHEEVVTHCKQRLAHLGVTQIQSLKLNAPTE